MALDPNSDAVLKTVDIHQSLIARMSSASGAAKNWCVTVVSAVAIVAVDKANWKFALVAVIPTLLFAAIDIYYLSMERSVRESHKDFVEKLRSNTATSDHLFDVGKFDITFGDTLAAAASKSIWLFYLFIVLSLLAVAMIAK